MQHLCRLALHRCCRDTVVIQNCISTPYFSPELLDLGCQIPHLLQTCLKLDLRSSSASLFLYGYHNKEHCQKLRESFRNDAVHLSKKDVIILNSFAPNNKALEYMRQINFFLTKPNCKLELQIQSEISIPLSQHMIKQVLRKSARIQFNDTINQLDLMDIYGTFYAVRAKYKSSSM